MSEFHAFIKTFPMVVKLIQGFVDAWTAQQISTINVNYQEREEERETIIWAMEQARIAHDLVKVRALNRSLAALDSGGVMPTRSIQSP